MEDDHDFLKDQCFEVLLRTIDYKARIYAEKSDTFRKFCYVEKHLLDVTDELAKELISIERFYSSMNRAREYFLGNNY